MSEKHISTDAYLKAMSILSKDLTFNFLCEFDKEVKIQIKKRNQRIINV